MNQAIHYYGIDIQQKTVEFGPISLSDALAVIHDRMNNLKSFYEDEGICLSETMFGFSKPKDEFIEIILHARQQIDFKFERTVGKWLFIFPKVFTHEETLTSLDQLKDRTTMFFNQTSDAYQAYLVAKHPGTY
jgi:hypothetical protein